MSKLWSVRRNQKPRVYILVAVPFKGVSFLLELFRFLLAGMWMRSGASGNSPTPRQELGADPGGILQSWTTRVRWLWETGNLDLLQQLVYVLNHSRGQLWEVLG